MGVPYPLQERVQVFGLSKRVCPLPERLGQFHAFLHNLKKEGLNLPSRPTPRSLHPSRTSARPHSRLHGGDDPPRRTAPRRSCTPPGKSPGRAWAGCPSRCPKGRLASRTACLLLLS